LDSKTKHEENSPRRKIDYIKKYNKAEITISEIPEYKTRLSESSIKLSPAKVRSNPPIPIKKVNINFFTAQV